ncbi:MAG: Cna B-type domain-containing protein, partial [Peptoniphilus sp.]|nr:Cna B-type domain-containing protein [Peptoniphilus sp.]
MKNLINKFLFLLLVSVMVMGLHDTVFAEDSSVTFDSGRLMVFSPGSEYTDSALFDNFKGIMPGDTRSEEITVKNQCGDCDYIKVYLRAVPHGEDNPISEKVLQELRSDERRGETSELEYMYDFLSQLSMTVKNGTEEIYNSTLDDPGGLAENVYLGTLHENESLKLDLELKVSLDMGNEYADRIGEVDWVFVVEGFDRPTPPPEDDRLIVRKIWIDSGENRPSSVKIQLIKDGEAQDEVELSQENNWVHTWYSKKGHKWTVAEVDVPEGYEVIYNKVGNTIIVTNIEKGEPGSPE